MAVLAGDTNEWLKNKACDNWYRNSSGVYTNCSNRGIVGSMRSASKSLFVCAECAKEMKAKGFIVDML